MTPTVLAESPKILPEKPTAIFDVDETLVLWRRPDGAPSELLAIAIGEMWVWPHWVHMERLKNHKRIGHNVVVWSHGGVEWATKVVKALKLEDYVDVIMPKGAWFYDDKPDEIITPTTQRYVQPEDSWNV